MIEFGASPRGPIGLVQAARALALLRGRAHVEVQDIRDLTPDLLRHRIVLSYDALSDGVTADELLEQVLATVPEPGARRLMRTERERPERRGADERVTARRLLAPPAARQGPGPIAQPLIEALDLAVNRLVARTLPGDRRAAGVGLGTELAQLRPYEIGDDVRHIDAAASARTGHPARAPARARAGADDVDRARRLALDGVRDRAAAQGRRGRGRGARVRPPRRAPRGQRRAGHLRRRCRAGARRRAGRGRAWSRCAGGWRRASRSTGARIPRRWPTRCARVGQLAGQPGLVVVISDFRDQRGMGAPARLAARPPLRAGDRGRSIRARPSCPRSGT